MKKNNKNKTEFFLIIIISIIMSVSFVSANETMATENNDTQRLFALEVQLLELIQASRLDQNNLPPFYLDNRLSTSADLHAQEMVQYSYFSSTSLNGDTVYDRIIKTGYCPIVSNQTMAAILFNNFIPSDQALTSLHNNLIGNEQDGELRMFSPDLKDIGISIRTGTVLVGDRTFNFYLAVCDLGTEGLSVAEKEAFYVINNLVPKKLDTNLQAISESEFEPFVQKVVASLLAHNGLSTDDTDVIEFLNEDLTDKKEGVTEHTEYSGCAVNKNIDFFIFSSTDPVFLDYSNISDENAVILMERMIEKETNVLLDNRILLNYHFKDIGLVFKTMYINDLNGNDYCLQALIVVSGKSNADCY